MRNQSTQLPAKESSSSVFEDFKCLDVSPLEVSKLADHLVGLEDLCGTIQEDNCQKLAFLVMQKIYSGNLCGDSAQGVSGTSSGSVAVARESSGRSLPLNVLESSR